jgi:hypothetical protein
MCLSVYPPVNFWLTESWINLCVTLYILWQLSPKSKLYYDRRSVGQSVLVSGTHLGHSTNFSPSFFNYFFRQLLVCWSETPSLTRGRVCNFQLLLESASGAFLALESRETHGHILFSQFWDSPTLEGQVPVLISSRNRVSQLYQQALSLSNFFTYYYIIHRNFLINTMHICICKASFNSDCAFNALSKLTPVTISV